MRERSSPKRPNFVSTNEKAKSEAVAPVCPASEGHAGILLLLHRWSRGYRFDKENCVVGLRRRHPMAPVLSVPGFMRCLKPLAENAATGQFAKIHHEARNRK